MCKPLIQVQCNVKYVKIIFPYLKCVEAKTSIYWIVAKEFQEHEQKGILMDIVLWRQKGRNSIKHSFMWPRSGGST